MASFTRYADHEEISDDPASGHVLRVSAHPSQLGGESPAEETFVPLVARALVTAGRFQVTADSLELIELFQSVARRAGDVLQRPVVAYANGEEVVITFDPEEPSGLVRQTALYAGADNDAVGS